TQGTSTQFLSYREKLKNLQLVENIVCHIFLCLYDSQKVVFISSEGIGIVVIPSSNLALGTTRMVTGGGTVVMEGGQSRWFLLRRIRSETGIGTREIFHRTEAFPYRSRSLFLLPSQTGSSYLIIECIHFLVLLLDQVHTVPESSEEKGEERYFNLLHLRDNRLEGKKNGEVNVEIRSSLD
ncbi:hypothetical protein PENTCL1PPCAC_6649, partial [Pristionchus entomophagus]